MEERFTDSEWRQPPLFEQNFPNMPCLAHIAQLQTWRWLGEKVSEGKTGFFLASFQHTIARAAELLPQELYSSAVVSPLEIACQFTRLSNPGA
jgi:hypothetical protein